MLNYVFHVDENLVKYITYKSIGHIIRNKEKGRMI